MTKESFNRVPAQDMTPINHSVFTEPVTSVITRLGSDADSGLTKAEAAARRESLGDNRLAKALPPPLWHKLLAQFNQSVIYILLVAAILSLFLGERLEAAAIFSIIILNTLLGFFQEQKAEKAISSLEQLSTPTAKVLRGGVLHSIAAETLVPGDIVEVEAGDRIPADLRLISTFSFKVQEAALTGESVSVEKDASVTPAKDAVLAERANMGFMGTSAVAGKARGVVVATGMKTELGSIAGLLGLKDREPTPLQKRLEELGRGLVIACLALVVLIFIIQLLRGQNPSEIFLVAISLAVAAVPEGLPAVVTISLALGLQRMVKRNALIRRLASVETLGSVTVICSDKTGTLTHNEMMVTELVVGVHHYRITGEGYAPQGDFIRLSYVGTDSSEGKHIDPQEEADMIHALTIGAWCNNAQLRAPKSDGSSSGKDETWHILGDPTEGALVVLARKAGVERNTGQTVIHEVPFDSRRQMMSVVLQDEGGQEILYSKGAPEAVLGCCTRELWEGRVVALSSARRAQWQKKGYSMAGRALRVLALAYKDVNSGSADYEEQNLVLAGLVGMMDPPRASARIAVMKCRSAGIRPVMITGDHAATALAIARQLGIAGEQHTAMTGTQLEAFGDEELLSHIDHQCVYARVAPAHKLRIVEALKASGQVVAMTGDGVNDAPAVKLADIGISMGISGTDVTKEASDMILVDDNFASIVNAVEEGRGIYDNIQGFVHYLLSCNASEIALVLFAVLAGWPIPLLPIQILWINLVTDGIPALALAMEKPAPDVMNRPPRKPNEPFFAAGRGARILIHGILLATTAIVGFMYAYSRGDVTYAQAFAFYIVTFSQLFFAFACRSQRHTLFELGIFSNPMLLAAITLSGLLQIALLWFSFTQEIFFRASPQFGTDWLLIILLALTPVSVVEVVKIIRKQVCIGGRGAKTET